MFEDVGVLEAMRQCHEGAASAAASSPCLLSGADLLEALDLVHQAEQALAGTKLRIIREITARGIPAEQGQKNTGKWLRNRLRMDATPARELAETAEALGKRPMVEDALVEGKIDLKQAATIAHALNQIPDDLEDFPDIPADKVTDQAEALLLDFADKLPANELRKAGDRILDHVAPEIAEQAEEEALRRKEKAARRKRGLTLSTPYDGLVRVSGNLTAEDAAAVNAALHPLCTPIPDDDRTQPQKRADALVEICRLAMRTGKLPDDGGEPPQTTVIVKYDPLTAQLSMGLLPNGERVTPESVRRLACDCRVLPLVLGGQSQILDAGRSRRTASPAQRRALAVRDGGCSFPSCDRPARWTDVVLPRFHGQMLADSA